MEFFNKKQDVVDLQLTAYGKQLLSRGLFKPVYYAFSDDGIMYDGRWMTGSSGEINPSEAETRIQEETPRLKTQYRKVGAERAIFNAFDASSAYNNLREIADVIEASTFQEFIEETQKITIKADFAESERLLESVLGTKSFNNSNNPAWSALFYHGEISSSLSYYQKNDVLVNIPQLNCTLKDQGYRMEPKYDPYEVLSKPKNVIQGLSQKADLFEAGGETQVRGRNGLFFEEIQADSKTVQVEDLVTTIEQGSLFIEKDFLFISLEEANVDFTRDNFMIEVYEVTTTSEQDNGEEELVKLFFKDESGIQLGNVIETNSDILNRSVEEIFYFEVDEEINSKVGCYLIGQDKHLKEQSLYITNVFDCESMQQSGEITIDPYLALPEVNVGDTC